jgi:hypothetical protein
VKGKAKYLAESFSLCCSVHQKSYTECTGVILYVTQNISTLFCTAVRHVIVTRPLLGDKNVMFMRDFLFDDTSGVKNSLSVC